VSDPPNPLTHLQLSSYIIGRDRSELGKATESVTPNLSGETGRFGRSTPTFAPAI